MRKLTLLALLVGSLAYAHPTTEEEKKEVYNFIQKQLEEGKIDITTAQKMWISYARCCEESTEDA